VVLCGVQERERLTKPVVSLDYRLALVGPDERAGDRVALREACLTTTSPTAPRLIGWNSGPPRAHAHEQRVVGAVRKKDDTILASRAWGRGLMPDLGRGPQAPRPAWLLLAVVVQGTL
jgi:hypothetical protein